MSLVGLTEPKTRGTEKEPRGENLNPAKLPKKGKVGKQERGSRVFLGSSMGGEGLGGKGRPKVQTGRQGGGESRRTRRPPTNEF